MKTYFKTVISKVKQHSYFKSDIPLLKKQLVEENSKKERSKLLKLIDSLAGFDDDVEFLDF